jgi:hypothetical protein
VRWDTLCRTRVFQSGVIYGSCNAFQCIQGAKRDRTNFHNKRAGTSYAELVVLHPVGSAGHIVQNLIALFLMLVWDM